MKDRAVGCNRPGEDSGRIGADQTGQDGLGIVDGKMVKLSSAIGSIEIPIKIVVRRGFLSGVFQAIHGRRETNTIKLTQDDILDPFYPPQISN
ncbi:MAG: hypothetical protein GY803_19745 [Chloroflexi bacterium]|nr:hypothetical protein [Chloroflexota bacterium]